MNESQVNHVPTSAADASQTGLLGLLIVLAKHKRKIVAAPIIAVLAASAITLLLPNVFRATAKLMPPQQAQSGAGMLLSQLGGIAGVAAATGLKSPNDLYIGMLKSRTVADNLVSKFKLTTVYDTDSAEKARRILERNTLIGSGRDGLITISVDDYDRKKAALLANSYVSELTALTNTLAVTEAAKRRLFFERQLELSKNNLAQAEIKLRGALDKTGVINVDSDSRAILETIGRVRAQISAKKIELDSMKSFVTVNNRDYIRAREELNSLRTELYKLQNGSGESNGAAGAGSQPGGLSNIGLLRDVKYHQMLYELLAKQYEVARLEEAKDAAVVQVLDAATAPEQKAGPARTLIVLATGTLALLLSIGWAFVIETRERALRIPETAAQWRELKRHLKAR